MTTLTVNTSLLSLVTEVLGDFTLEERLFTAFDVTKECRTRVNLGNGKFYVRHEDVKDLVNEFYTKEIPPFQNGSDYIREDHGFVYNGRAVSCQIYRPIGVDPSKYLPDDVAVNHVRNGSAFIPSANKGPFVKSQTGIAIAAQPLPWNKDPNSKGLPIVTTSKSTVSTPAPVAPIAPVAPTAASMPGTTLKKGSRGRVLVPNRYVRALGLNKGDVIGVHINKGSFTTLIVLEKLSTKTTHTFVVDKYCNVRLSSDIVSELSNCMSINLVYDALRQEIILS